MSSLTLKVTDAGRAAIVNAQNTGTAPVLVSQIGVTDQAFVAAADTAALPGELKRLATFAGAAVAADTIHVTIRDDSADVYSCRGFAMYLDDGTLFASYGQADPIGEKSAQSMFLLALDAIFTDIDATALAFGDTNFLLASATTETQGIVELATEAEAETGTDATRAMTPATHKGAVDARFGAGAPSAFVKTLLTAATALVFRTALSIKGAALYDTGTGNGLDADLLDGQHGAYYRAWANLTGVPASFPPSAHQHAWADITGAPVYTTRWAAWDEVTGKPATFPPSPHSQDWSTILNAPVQTTRWPNWSEVGNKPNFAAVATTGNYADLNGQPNLSQYMPVVGGTFTGQVAFDSTGVDIRTTYLYNHVRRMLLALNPTAGKASLVAYASDGGTALGQLDIGTGGFNYNGAGAFAGGLTAASYNSPALSRTVKHDIAPCRYGLAEFLQIPWVEYRYDKSITEDDRLRFGSIVEDVEPVAPLLVIHREGQVSTFEYDQFIPVIGQALRQYIALANARADRAAARADRAEARMELLARSLAELSERLRVLERTVTGRHHEGWPPA